MATKKFMPAARTAPVKQSAPRRTKMPEGLQSSGVAELEGKDGEPVLVPILAQPYMKAPATDPRLRAGTVTAEHVNVCGYDLPPILRGIEPCAGRDYDVKVIWISRRQIEAMMAAVLEKYPELAQMLEIMKCFMCRLDTVRDEATLGIVASLGFMKKHMPEDSPAFSNLNSVVKMLGHWNDENRLHLY